LLVKFGEPGKASPPDEMSGGLFVFDRAGLYNRRKSGNLHL
jgi:hypothetical protein